MKAKIRRNRNEIKLAKNISSEEKEARKRWQMFKNGKEKQIYISK